MSWVIALGIGFGLGLASFGGLWLTIQQVAHKPQAQVLLAGSSLARLGLVALVFCGLIREGPDRVLAGLGGLWLARGYLVHRLGGTRHE
jgi:F1F0 ATPase subunit 2